MMRPRHSLDASGTTNGITPVAIAVEPDYTDNKIFLHNVSSSQGVWPVGSHSGLLDGWGR